MAMSVRNLALACGTALLLAGALAFQGAGAKNPVRYLMIHTDDAGLCATVNAATVDALERGTVTSASIMAPCPGFEEFARYAAAHPEMDWGVHLTLNSELSAEARWGPLTSRDKVPSLVGGDGRFHFSTQMVAELANREEVELELRTQIERVKAAGIRLSHLDHHMWVMLSRPDLFQLFIQLGVEYDLPVRIHKQLPEGFNTWSANDSGETYRNGLELLNAHHFPQFDFIDANNYDAPATEKRAYFLDLIRGLKPGVSEFVIHVAYNRPGSPRPPASDGRVADLRMFTSLEIEEEIRAAGVKLINWRQFRQMAAARSR